jgi:AraC-like DNA-binding protein
MEKLLSAIFPNEHFVDLSLYQFGYQECLPLHSYGPATRNHFLFHYIFSGRGKFTVFNDDRNEKQEYYLESGQGFLIWPLQHTLYMADEKNPWVYAWVEFDGLKAKELVTQAGLSYNKPVYVSRDSGEREIMKNELLSIINNRNSPAIYLVGHLYLFMNAFISSSSLRKKVTGGSLREFYVREALSFVEQHYHEDIGIEDIAAFCHLDRAYMGKIFKSVLHASPQEFLIQYRINKSCELMRITDNTISEISYMVGYQNQFNFSRVFKKTIGKSPREWRGENKLR